MMPKWNSWNDDNMVAGFYQQPRDTIEAAFVGASTVASGVSTIDMFQDFGLCSHSFAVGHEPLVSSYYWIKEVERLHGGSLKVVVLDPSALFYSKEQTNKTAVAEKATGHMKLSPVKLEALWEYQNHYQDFGFIDNLVPIVRYHSRWASLETRDIESFLGQGLHTESHGQYVSFGVSAGNTKDDLLLVPTDDITDKQEKDTQDLLGECQEYNVEMMQRIIDFCKEKNLKLVLASLPHMGWTDDKHDTVQAIAKENDLLFLDMNSPDDFERMGLYPPYDYSDHNHANASGARKITKRIGEFLADNGITGDSASDERYSFMAQDVSFYNECFTGMEFATCKSLDEYLELCNNERYVVLVSSKGDAAKNLGAKAREALRSLGLKQLADAKELSSYAAIADGGDKIEEKLSSSSSEGTSIKCSYKEGVITYSKARELDSDIPTLLMVKSVAVKNGVKAVVELAGESLCENETGLNIVVIDKMMDCVVDSSCFNTCDKSQRVTDLVPSSYDERVAGGKSGK